MGFFSFLKYTFIIFEAHLASSCGSPFENRCPKRKLRHNKVHDLNSSDACEKVYFPYASDGEEAHGSSLNRREADMSGFHRNSVAQ
jgi:hypothetical protein